MLFFTTIKRCDHSISMLCFIKLLSYKCPHVLLFEVTLRDEKYNHHSNSLGFQLSKFLVITSFHVFVMEAFTLHFIFSFIQAICKCCSRRLIDYSQNIKTRDLPCIFGCLSLGIVEIRRNSYNCIFHFCT